MQKRKPAVILFFAGFCLILLQFFMIREITAMLLGTEVVIALVTVAYFVGYSIGYGFADRISYSVLRSFALIFWGIHLTLPFSLRYLAGYFGRGEGYASSFVVILFFSSVALSSFYSLLLPRFIENESNGDGSGLTRLYAMELIGAIFGAASLFIFGGISPIAIPILYQIGLATIIVLVMGNRLYYFVALSACAVYFFAFATLQKDSTEYFYKKVRHFKAPEVLYSVNSPYQKVDIVRSRDGARYIYLNGLQNYGSRTLKEFNTFLSRVPAQLVNPKETLIVGSGSMESVAYTSALSENVHTVEIDGAVIAGSKKYMLDLSGLDKVRNWKVTIEDAKRFLGGNDKKYDLIVMDIPAPLTVQVGLLYSVDFYKLVRSRLTENGVISVSLCGTLRKNNPTPDTIASAISRVFEDYYFYTPKMKGKSRTYVIAGKNIPFKKEDLEKVAEMNGAMETKVFSRKKAKRVIGEFEPMRAGAMTFPVKRSLVRVAKRLTSTKTRR